MPQNTRPAYCDSWGYIIGDALDKAGDISTKVGTVAVGAGVVQVAISPATAGGTAVTGGGTIAAGTTLIAAGAASQAIGKFVKFVAAGGTANTPYFAADSAASGFNLSASYVRPSDLCRGIANCRCSNTVCRRKSVRVGRWLVVAKLCLFFLPLPLFAGLSVMMSSLTAVVISCGCALLAAFLLGATLRSIDWATVSFLLVTLLASHFSNVGFIDPDFAIIAILIFFILALRPIYQREWMAD